MNGLSAVVLTKNSEKQIHETLKSLSFCDEVIIIDDYSTDNTVIIAQKYKAVIFKRKLSNDFSSQRNFGLEKARNEWVLFVDSDEVISDKLKNKICKAINQNEYSGFYIKRVDLFLGKSMKGGEFGDIYLLRLAKKDSGKWQRLIHEQWDVNGKKGRIYEPILHKSHINLKSFVTKLNNYSQLHYIENSKEKKKTWYIKSIIYPFGKFFYNFILKRGYRDGVHGFVAAVLMSMHSFLSWSQLCLQKNYK